MSCGLRKPKAVVPECPLSARCGSLVQSGRCSLVARKRLFASTTDAAVFHPPAMEELTEEQPSLVLLVRPCGEIFVAPRFCNHWPARAGTLPLVV